MDREPVLTAGAITAFVAALVALLVALGLPLGEHVQQAILGAIAVAAPIVAAWWARRHAYSPATVRALTGGDPQP